MQRIADILQQEMPHARKVLLLQAGHMANMEQPEAFNHVILVFLAECCA
jgi:pimeloyl-ACP methyl ester carboxylesterase